MIVFRSHWRSEAAASELSRLAVSGRMASVAQCDEVLFGIVAGVATKFLVMNLKIRHRTARLTSPAVATQDLLPKSVVCNRIQPQAPRPRSDRGLGACGWILLHTTLLGNRSCVATAGDVNRAVRCRILRFITRNFVATPATIPKRTSSHCATLAMRPLTATRDNSLAAASERQWLLKTIIYGVTLKATPKPFAPPTFVVP